MGKTTVNIQWGPVPDEMLPARKARLTRLVDHIGRELAEVIEGEWEVTLNFPPPQDSTFGDPNRPKDSANRLRIRGV